MYFVVYWIKVIIFYAANLKAPVSMELPFPLEKGMTIRFDFFCSYKYKKDFHLRLEDQSGDNILLDIYFKNNTSQWVFNSKTNGKWHSEEAVILVDDLTEVHLKPGSKYSMYIMVLEDIFTVGINSKQINNYRHFNNQHQVQFLNIEGSVWIKKAIIETETGNVNIRPKPETEEHSVSRTPSGSRNVEKQDRQQQRRISNGSTTSGASAEDDAEKIHKKQTRPQSAFRSMLNLGKSDEYDDEETTPNKDTRDRRHSKELDNESFAPLSAITRVISTSDVELPRHNVSNHGELSLLEMAKVAPDEGPVYDAPDTWKPKKPKKIKSDLASSAVQQVIDDESIQKQVSSMQLGQSSSTHKYFNKSRDKLSQNKIDKRESKLLDQIPESNEEGQPTEVKKELKPLKSILSSKCKNYVQSILPESAETVSEETLESPVAVVRPPTPPKKHSTEELLPVLQLPGGKMLKKKLSQRTESTETLKPTIDKEEVKKEKKEEEKDKSAEVKEHKSELTPTVDKEGLDKKMPFKPLPTFPSTSMQVPDVDQAPLSVTGPIKYEPLAQRKLSIVSDICVTSKSKPLSRNSDDTLNYYAQPKCWCALL